MKQESIPQTFGEYRVGQNFNPSANPDVEMVKRRAADLIDAIHTIEVKTINNPTYQAEVTRCQALAITNIEQGAMWAVKAMTKAPWIPLVQGESQ